MTCHFCNRRINAGELNQHHIKPKSEGGIETAPAHQACHIKHHSQAGHFREWGRKGGLRTAALGWWIFNLKRGKQPADPLRWIPFGRA